MHLDTEAFTRHNGGTTPSLLLRRDQLENRYRTTISSLYLHLNCYDHSPAIKSSNPHLLPLFSLRDEEEGAEAGQEPAQRSQLRATM